MLRYIHEFDISLSFLDPDKKYEAQIYADAEGITWKNNPDKVASSKKIVTAADKLDLKLAPGGGTAIRFAVQ